MDENDRPPRAWKDLAPDEQTALRIDSGRWQDGLPPTCPLETKIARFRAWLPTRDVDYRDER